MSAPATWAGAARRYALLGERLTSLRLRLASSPDSAPRSVIRRELLALATARAGTAAVREILAVLDSAFTPLSPAEELIVGRAATESGLASRAAIGFARARAAGLGSSEDRFAYATALTRLNRNGEAAFQFQLVRSPRPLAALAAYQAARALVRDGQLSEGRSALVQVARKYPRDTAAAASAFFLQGDLASDDRAEAEARSLYRIVATRYPTSRFAAPARFRAATIALLSGRPQLAAEEFDALAERYPASDEALGAMYWAGRAWAAGGDSALARARWQGVTGRDRLSYYAALSAQRLGDQPWTPPSARDSFPADPAIDGIVVRARLLARLGLTAESRWELERLAKSFESSPERLLILAHAYREQGMASQAIQLARRALARGAPADARTFRLIYPMVHEDALFAEAAEQGVDPILLAALIRQESSFNPNATSPAGARGLAQVMPELGERLARELDYPVWDPVLLYQPDVSIQLGAVHLRELFTRYNQRAHILAAYNAGMSRVERWSKRVGVSDPEIFAERISFVETRDYVRVIQRNEEIYRALYGGEADPARRRRPSSSGGGSRKPGGRRPPDVSLAGEAAGPTLQRPLHSKVHPVARRHSAAGSARPGWRGHLRPRSRLAVLLPEPPGRAGALPSVRLSLHRSPWDRHLGPSLPGRLLTGPSPAPGPCRAGRGGARSARYRQPRASGSPGLPVPGRSDGAAQGESARGPHRPGPRRHA